MKIYDTHGNLVPSITNKDTNYTYSKTTDSLEAIRDRIDTINTADQVDLDAIITYLAHASYGLDAIKTLLNTFPAILDTLDDRTASIVTDYLAHATYGLDAIKSLLNTHSGVLSTLDSRTATIVTDYLAHASYGLDAIKSALNTANAIIPDLRSNLVRWGVVDSIDGNSFVSADLAGMGVDAMPGWWVYVMQADNAAPEGEYRLLTDYANDGDCDHEAFSVALEVGDRVQLLHPSIGMLGQVDTAAATGAVTTTDFMMAYIKQLITGLALDGSAPHSYDYTKATVPGWLHGFHMIRRILFVIPEAVASITAHNTAIKAELDKMGVVFTITQADALTYPDFESLTLVVLGSPLGDASWTTSNLAHIKSIFGLPVLCVDGTAAAYLAMGTDGDNAASKTVLNAVANIEASVMGIGVDDTTGLAAGANTVAASGVTFATLDMSDSDVTEIWYAWENTEANTDVLIGEIRKTMPDGTVGIDADGAEVPGTLAFYGCAYSMGSLNTLGQAVFHLLAEQLLHSSTAGLAVLLSGNVGNLVNTIGNKKTATATGAVSNAKKMMGYVKQLVTELQVVDGNVDDIEADTADMQPKLGTPAADISADIAAIKGIVDTPANFMADVSAITAAGPTKDEMDTGHGLLATEAKQDIIGTNVDQIEVLVADKVMGRLQVITTTWDLLRGSAGAGTDVLFTGTAQAVILESLIVRMPTTADVTDTDPITSMAIATDDAEPGIIIAAADAPVASMTPESQFGWTGTLYIPVDTEIEGTLAGGDADAECLAIVTATYRAVVSGGYLA